MKRSSAHDMPGKFSDDPNEDLRIENEILRMKLQVEAGALIGIKNDIPPELENMFLQNVVAFVEASKNMKLVNLYEFLGNPAYKNIAVLSPDEIGTELSRLKQLLDEKQVILDILDTYDDTTIYKFITEELFKQQTYEKVVPGMVRHFTYEEFHPNHRLDIRERAMDFLGDWFERKMNEHCWELNAEFVLPDASVMRRAEVIKKIKAIFANYTVFTRCQYAIGEIAFEWNEKECKGLGFCEGAVKYQAVQENGEAIAFEGPFKFYLSNEGRWWSIFYFVFPGFTW